MFSRPKISSEARSTECKCQQMTTNDNKWQQQHGSDYATYSYDIAANTIEGVVYPSADPCIFELRYPQTDIIGTAVQ